MGQTELSRDLDGLQRTGTAGSRIRPQQAGSQVLGSPGGNTNKSILHAMNTVAPTKRGSQKTFEDPHGFEETASALLLLLLFVEREPSEPRDGSCVVPLSSQAGLRAPARFKALITAVRFKALTVIIV
ncbi:unnamed protein product [Gadus morhua 'NCC']